MRKLTMLALSLFALCGAVSAQQFDLYQDDLEINSNTIWSGPRQVECQGNLTISGTNLGAQLQIAPNVSVTVFEDLIVNGVGTGSVYRAKLSFSGRSVSDGEKQIIVYGTFYAGTNSSITPTWATYIEAANMVIEPGAKFTVKNDSHVSVRNLTLSNAVEVDATSTFYVTEKLIVPAGAIVDASGISLSGSAIVEIGEGAILKGTPSQQTFSINLNANQWNFVGFPHATDISPLVGENMPMVWAVDYDYSANAWSSDFMHYNEETQGQLEKGKGIFVWTEEDATISVTEMRDEQTISLTYPGNASVEKWFALSNPYSKSLDITRFVSKNKAAIQGGEGNGGVYKYNGNQGTFEFLQSGEIKPGEGFFVCMKAISNMNSITFDLFNQYYVASSAESVAANESMTISVLTDGYAVPVEFLQNDAATVGFDEFDAPKMFGNGFVAEPYLVSDGKNLCAEVVNASSYTATMNIKSNEARTVQIVASNIPEGYSLVLKDGENEIAMSEGDVYTTEIANGENADRFKLLINQTNASITDAENVSNLSVMNVNRNITISGEKNVRTEVYNTLGQKVFETEESNFELNTVPAGAYVIKVQGSKSVKSQKIIIE